ncbi:superoxide dismutase family protein [Ekhidna sp.]|uniref:superoxide dismutase family protein n=1 Tax=Ekhidna sp. TaxID=2608089 RepID=UPI0032EAAC43
MRALTFLLITVFIGGCDKKDPGPKTFAAADIYWVSSEDGKIYEQGELMGNASFVYQDGVTTLEVSLSGMAPDTQHAMHLHQGALEEPGRHWNRGGFVNHCDKKSLGNFWLKPFAGDIGNITIDENGNGTFSIQTNLWSLGTDDDSDISGTVIFIHEKYEDFGNECDPNHSHDHEHSNAKIAGGTVVLDAQVLR